MSTEQIQILAISTAQHTPIPGFGFSFSEIKKMVNNK